MKLNELTTHQLANELLHYPDRPVCISVDVSVSEHDAGRRCFTNEYFGINVNDRFCSDEIVLLFGGYLNYELP